MQFTVSCEFQWAAQAYAFFTVVSATISMDVKPDKNTTVYADNHMFFGIFAYCKDLRGIISYQLPCSVQMHTFLRGI